MAFDITRSDPSLYPQSRRIGLFWNESLKSPVAPSLVANRILEIAESTSPKLRYPVGPDAEPFWQWRTSMTDEQWVDWNAQEDTDWYDAVEATFGMNCRPEKLEKEK